MGRYATNQPVKVKTEGHEHEGRAGIVIKEPESTPGHVVVQLDATPDKESTADLIADADLQELH